MSAHPSIHSFHIFLSPLCVNSKSFSKSLFSLIQPSTSPWVQKVNHWGFSYCRRHAGSIHSPCEFIRSANSISMQLPCCRFIIYIVYLYSSVTSLSAHCRRTSPPPFDGKLTKIDRAICETIEVQYTLRLSFALRNFNCHKVNSGCCWILNLLLVYESLARQRLTYRCTRIGAHAEIRLWSGDNTLAASTIWILLNSPLMTSYTSGIQSRMHT